MRSTGWRHEAQDLSHTALEELRLLTNLNQNRQPLLQVFLVGQEELRHTVQQPGLEQLHQRIVAACHLAPLTVDALEGYVKHRLGHVGWEGEPKLGDDIYEPLHEYSEGVPRIVNQICSRLFLHGMVEEKTAFNREDVLEVIESLAEENLLPLDSRTAPVSAVV